MRDPSHTCVNCHVFNPLEDKKDVIGQCRQNPPRPGASSREGARDKARVFAEWPVVFGDDWCGKFEKRKIQSE